MAVSGLALIAVATSAAMSAGRSTGATGGERAPGDVAVVVVDLDVAQEAVLAQVEEELADEDVRRADALGELVLRGRPVAVLVGVRDPGDEPQRDELAAQLVGLDGELLLA